MRRTQSTALLRLVSSSLRLSLACGVVGVFASAGFAAGTSSDTYYVNDQLASTVATADAAGEIAQIESDAFGTQDGAVAKDSRFTGKPYDADMGAYVFPFRNYRSDEARWMSADPSGFPDGVNQSRYVENVIIAIDAMGLSAQDAWTLTASVNNKSIYYIPHGFNNTTVTVTFGMDVKAVYDASPAVTSAYQFDLSGTITVEGQDLADVTKSIQINLDTSSVSGSSGEITSPNWTASLGEGTYTGTVTGVLSNGNLNPNSSVLKNARLREAWLVSA